MMNASSGHTLGQIVGDWWELNVVLPLLEEVASELNLYLDNRSKPRLGIREGSKVLWSDMEGNEVDYDFVFELNGTSEKLGLPVAFMESFWRRGARHSKDKARDDTNKLLPMRSTYTTARYLGIAACGEFTEPARDYVKTRNVDLFFISKEHVLAAFESSGVNIDYADNLDETNKAKILNAAQNLLTPQKKVAIFEKLKEISGESTFDGFKNRLISSFKATPQQFRIYLIEKTGPWIFQSARQVEEFIDRRSFESKGPIQSVSTFTYEVTFSDGTDFVEECESVDQLNEANRRVQALAEHFNQSLRTKS